MELDSNLCLEGTHLRGTTARLRVGSRKQVVPQVARRLQHSYAVSVLQLFRGTKTRSHHEKVLRSIPRKNETESREKMSSAWHLDEKR